MKKSLLVLAMALVVALVPLGAMADTVYTFIYQNGNVIPGASQYGTVTLSSVASGGTTCTASETNCLKVTVAMDSPYLLHTANDALGFNASSSFNFYSAGATSQTNTAHPFAMDGWGKYTSVVDVTGSDTANLVFYLGSSSALSFSTSTGGNGTTYFAAFVTPGTSCTGYIGTGGPNGNNTGTGPGIPAGTNSNCSSTRTPEPASLALLGAGLLSLGGLFKRRK